MLRMKASTPQAHRFGRPRMLLLFQRLVVGGVRGHHLRLQGLHAFGVERRSWVGDDQSVDAVGVARSEEGHRVTTKAMPQQVCHCEAESVEKRCEVGDGGVEAESLSVAEW